MDAGFPVDRMEDIALLGRDMKWQWFERLAAWVFEQNGFTVSAGAVRIFGRKRRQYDIIAEGSRFVFAADCKRWKGGRYKTSQLRMAAEGQIERCTLLKKGFDKEIIPLVVTLMHEDIVMHSGVPLVPIDMLNSFINSWEQAEGGIMRI